MSEPTSFVPGDASTTGGRSPWVGMSVIMLGTLMVVLDTTIVNVALPQIGESLGAGRGIEWIVSAYLLAVATAMPVSGWISNRYGHKRIYLGALVVFIVASLGCALSPSLPALVGFRVLQGLGGGALMPVGMAIVFSIFPRERHGRAIGAWGIVAMAAPAIGPTIGGYLVTSVSWHWLFLVNVPVGIVAVAAGVRLLPVIPRTARTPFDVIGFVTGSAGLALLVLGLSEANGWGWGSPATLGCLLAGAAMLVAFVRNELRTEHPMLELRMFRNPTFSTASGITFLVVIAQYARLVFIPLQLEGLRGYTALEVGLMLAPAGVATAVAMQVGGRLADRLGPRAPLIVGTSLMAVGLLALANLGLTTPLWLIATFLAVQGTGMGLHAAPATVAAMDTLTSDLLGHGAAVRNLASQVGGAVSVALMGAVYAIVTPAGASPEQAQRGYDIVFYAALAGMLGALVLAVRLRPVRRAEPAEEVELEPAALALAD
jgi:EmrB/QacA subfamily drug resistance transporter